MQSDAWSWHAQAADAQLPEARRQPRLWPSAVLADVPGWGGFEAQAAGDEWPRQMGLGPEALRHTAPDADEQQLAEQVRLKLRTLRFREPCSLTRPCIQMLLRSMRSIGLSVPQNEAFAPPNRQTYELAGTRGRSWVDETQQHASKAEARRQVRSDLTAARFAASFLTRRGDSAAHDFYS